MNSGLHFFAILTVLVVGSLQYSVIKDNTLFANRNVEDRIVGGDPAVKNAFPYTLYNVITIGSGRALCGGAIISESWALTVAHCTVNTPQTGIESTAGEHDVTLDDGTEQKRTSVKVITHELYDGHTYENDIAVFQVDPVWVFGTAVGKICVPAAGYMALGICKVTGWGSIQEGGSTSTILRTTNVTLIKPEECRPFYGESAIFDTNVCGGTQGIDTCQGDSGAPAVLGNLRVLGISSWGNGCGRPGYPGVYTRVNSFSTWVISTTGVRAC